MLNLTEDFCIWLEQQWSVATARMKPEHICAELGFTLNEAIRDFEKETGKKAIEE